MRSLRYPVTMAVGVAVAISVALRQLFIWNEQWLWNRAPPLQLGDITPWVRGVVRVRDGAEPYALLAIVVAQLALTTLAMVWLARRSAVLQAVISGVLLLAVAGLSAVVPPRPPWFEVAAEPRRAIIVVLGALAATLAVGRSMRRRGGLSPWVAAALIPTCFVSTTLPSLLDVSCILAPAMRLASGFAPREVYLQYDLLPSLLAIGWTKLGGTSLGFTLVVGASFYALLIGLFLLARRLFTRGELAAPLLIALVVVRVYGVMIDANAAPQATPIRLDLWPILVAATLALGLRHWAVGAILGALFLFSRSMGTLYLGSYALALGGDWLAHRYGRAAAVRPAAGRGSGRGGARARPLSGSDRGRHRRRGGGVRPRRLGRRAPLPPAGRRHVAHRARVVLLVAVAHDRRLPAGSPSGSRSRCPAGRRRRASSRLRCWSRTRSTFSAAVTSTT